MSGARLKSGSLALFTAPSLPLAALGLPLGVYLPTYYSEHIGVSFAAVGMAFMLVRLVDMGFDPLIGGIMDRTRTRFGRFKPWMIAGSPILMLGIYMLFMAETGAGAFHLWLSLTILYLGFSVCQLSQVSWASTLSSEYDERSRIYAWWQIANVVGALTIVLFPVILTRVFDFPHHASVRAMGIALLLLVPVCVALATGFVAEAPPTRRQPAPRLREYIDVFRSSAVRRIVFSDILLATAVGVSGALFFFFFRHVKGVSEADASALILFFLVASLVGAPVWGIAARKLSKHVALIVATIVYVAALTVLGLFLSGSFWILAGGLFVLGISNSAPQLLLRAMMADAADEEHLRTGRDNTGMLFGFITAINKGGNALAIGVTFIFLGLTGYTPDMEGKAAAAPLYIIYVAFPSLLSLAAIGLLWRYPLTPARHGEIRRRLEMQSDARPESAPSPEQHAFPARCETQAS